MNDTEPTNEQLANFLMAQARSDPRMRGMRLSPPIIESLLSLRPDYREAALLKHRRFQEQINELSKALLAGQLQCDHILQSGKQCPNRNQPGHHQCGLHKSEEEDTYEALD